MTIKLAYYLNLFNSEFQLGDVLHLKSKGTRIGASNKNLSENMEKYQRFHTISKDIKAKERKKKRKTNKYDIPLPVSVYDSQAQKSNFFPGLKRILREDRFN